MMRKTIPALLLSLASLFLVVFFAAAQGPPPPPKGAEPAPEFLTPRQQSSPLVNPVNPDLLRKIEPQLLKKLLSAPGEPAPFIVYLRAQADLQAAVAAVPLGAQAVAEPLARRQAIVAALQQTAQNSQGAVLQLLTNPNGPTGQSAAGLVRPLWIVNAVAASGSLETILAVAARPEVAVVRLDDTITLERRLTPEAAHPGGAADRPAGQTVEWGISKIRADLVHQALGIDGRGVVLANIDTGVDWLHPALQSRYRGYKGPGKLPQHTANWFDATGEGAAYPVDTDGHGTHTMGTAVGQNGIGVAPGAQWIAVRAFDSSGGALNSWLHAAFQWALAPDGNPALAPHIVNNSWGSNNGFSTEFEADVQALLDAGIFPVFSAGNNGSAAGTVGSPGSLTNAFAVGATDSNDDITNFSSRGPSPWGQIKPEIAAPGKDVRSALPGGAYGLLNGTSMAAPHVSGLAALLLQASPALSGDVAGLTRAMTSTAVRLGSPTPNNDYGWGRIDAYQAIMSVISAGLLQGVVRDAAAQNAIAGALVQITPSLSGTTLTTVSDAAGRYVLGLRPDTYNVSVSAFGYEPATVKLINVTEDISTTQNFSLTPLPAGLLVGTVTDRPSGLPLSATVTVENTPVSAATAGGSYSLRLPVGVYTVTVSASKHRVAKIPNVRIVAGQTTPLNVALDPAPAILLVDSGRWYQESQIDFYRQALADARYTYELWQINSPFETPTDVPTAADLAGYDLVVWSAPLDSPGYVGANSALTDYLDGGGKLFLSGQDIGYFDGGGSLFGAQPYFRDYLKARYLQDNAGVDTVTALPDGPLAGLTLTISGGDGADNQSFPDVIASDDPDFASPLLHYDAVDEAAGLNVGRCLPYRAILLAFGLEGVNTRSDRQQVIERSIDWLFQPPPPTGLDLSPATDLRIGDFGAVVSHTMRLRNTGITTDQVSLALTGLGPYQWPTGALSPTVTLPPCTSQFLTVTVQLPAARLRHLTDTFTVRATSGNEPALTETITRHTKTPAPLLLVDDDRWFSFAAEFKTALAANGIAYDYWLVPKSWSGSEPDSPSLDILRMYPMTVWYTAYDWFQPLTAEEETRLGQYLDEGGRLFFSSQDFLYYHRLNHRDYFTFPHRYLGVQAHTEDFSSTLTTGRPDNPLGAYLGPDTLTFPPGYRNWTDALTPTASARVATVGQVGQPNGLTQAGRGPGGRYWHTSFLAYGPELLPPGPRARLMQRAVGWLSWLGGSTVTAATDSVGSGAIISYSAVISNNGWEPIATAYFTATFPAYLTPQAASANLTAAGGQYLWRGPLAPGEQRAFTYTAQINQPLPVGTVISQTSWLAYSEHTVLFDRIAAVRAAPDLSGSELRVWPARDVAENQVLTYTVTLRNQGLTAAAGVTTVNALPPALALAGVEPGPGMVVSDSHHLTWTTALARDQAVTLTYRALISGQNHGRLSNVVWVDDGVNPALRLTAEAVFKPLPLYFPVIFKE